MAEAADGQTTRIEYLLNGTPVVVQVPEEITRANASAVFATRERQPLGRSGVVPTQDFLYMEGQDTIAAVYEAWMSMQQTYINGVVARARPTITRIETVVYPQTGTQQTRTFRNVYFPSWDSTTQRGSDNEHSVSWRSPQPPIVR